MSNRINIEPTKFINARTGHETFGVRIYDDYNQSYDNCWESVPDDDGEVFQLVLVNSADESISDMLDFIKTMQQGVYIGGRWYDWAWVKHQMEEYEKQAST
jgi:hypothetical protein